MYRITQNNDQPTSKQLVLPSKYRKIILKSLYDDLGHRGFDKTYGLVKDRFYWPRMRLDVESHCKNCGRCIPCKTLSTQAAPLSHLSSEKPLDLVCMDFLTIERDNKGVCNVLVITDHFTWSAQVYLTKDQKPFTVAKVLWEKYFVHYGFRKRMHSHQGRDFESKLIHEMFSLVGTTKSRSSPYHPQGDP